MENNRVHDRLRGRRGMTLGETMVALVLISLLTLCLATGISFGARQYNRALIHSESRILSSTLTSIIREELGSTAKIKREADGKISYFSPGYNQKDGPVAGGLSQLTSNAEGHLVVKKNDTNTEFELLSDAAYSGRYQLKARVDQLEYDGSKFTVKLTVTDTNNHPQVTTTFDVIPLNNIEVLT